MGPVRECPHAEQYQQRDRGARQQLEEPAARVLGIGQALGDEYPVAGTGQRDHLGSGERGVERAQPAKHERGLGRAEGRSGRHVGAGLLGARGPAESGDQPGADQSQDQVLDQRRQVEPRPEDRIGEGEQQTDEEHDRYCEQRAPRDGRSPFASRLGCLVLAGELEHSWGVDQVARDQGQPASCRREGQAQPAAVGAERCADAEQQHDAGNGRGDHPRA